MSSHFGRSIFPFFAALNVLRMHCPVAPRWSLQSPEANESSFLSPYFPTNLRYPKSHDENRRCSFLYILYIFCTFGTLCKCITASIRLIEVVELPSCLSSAKPCTGRASCCCAQMATSGCSRRVQGGGGGGRGRSSRRWSSLGGSLDTTPGCPGACPMWFRRFPAVDSPCSNAYEVQHGQCMQVSRSSGHTSFKTTLVSLLAEGTAVFK